MSNAATVLDAHELLTRVAEVLRPLVEKQGGALSLAADPVHAGELLSVGPQGFRVVLALDDEEPIGDPQASDRAVRCGFSLFVQRSKGLPAKAGADVASAVPGATLPPILHLADDLIQIVRSLAIPGDPAGPRLRRASWVAAEPGGDEDARQRLLRTRRLDFTVRRHLRHPFAEKLTA